MSHNRVIPRDLFNEAKLLKCLGQLSLLIHDGKDVPAGLAFYHEEPSEGFRIAQDSSSGAIYCENLSLCFAQRVIHLRCPLNSREPYPLQYVLYDETEGDVFNPDGSPSSEFLQFLVTLL